MPAKENSLLFFILVLGWQLIGRKIGWVLSRAVLYTAPIAVTAIICVIWGVGLAFGYRLLAVHFHPGIILKVLGYGSVAYVSVLNYGLIDERTIPEDKMPIHLLIKTVPLLVFIIASAMFAFTIH